MLLKDTCIAIIYLSIERYCRAKENNLSIKITKNNKNPNLDSWVTPHFVFPESEKTLYIEKISACEITRKTFYCFI